MKKAKWLWLVPTALALVFAFCLPRILLHFEKKEAAAKVETYDASNSVLNYEDLSIAQKLSLLADGNYSTLVVEKQVSFLTDMEVNNTFFAELDKLYECGAIDPDYYNTMVMHYADGVIITPYLVVDRIGNIAFQYYEIDSYDGWAFAKYDPEEGKILQLVNQEYADILVSNLLELESISNMSGADSMLEAIIHAWADYFGLVAEKITVCDNALDKAWIEGELNVYLSWCYLYDENGNRFAFALYYQTDYGILQFGGIPASEAKSLTAAAEQDEIEEMTEPTE
ncbi:MAG: hypothetical protein ACI4V3_07235 [Faecousia sp.]